MPSLLERLGVELPIVQAGMGGGCAGHELAAAVSEAGGLGTVGIVPPRLMAAEIEAARALTGRPIAVNLLLPFTTRRHREAAQEADAVVTFWGRPDRPGAAAWIHQAGSVAEARLAHEAGADGVIVQGVEAGGHVRGETPAMELLERVRAALPDGFPIWLAGGIAEPADVRAGLDGGAEACVLGTRFLASDECRAHREYKRRLIAGAETLLTELFGLGWPAPHRVLPNEATRRWCVRRPRGPAAIRTFNRLTGPLASRMPARAQDFLSRAQRSSVPLLGPQMALEDRGENLIEAGPLYAGETVARIADVRAAAELVGLLTPP